MASSPCDDDSVWSLSSDSASPSSSSGLTEERKFATPIKSTITEQDSPLSSSSDSLNSILILQPTAAARGRLSDISNVTSNSSFTTEDNRTSKKVAFVFQDSELMVASTTGVNMQELILQTGRSFKLLSSPRSPESTSTTDAGDEIVWHLTAEKEVDSGVEELLTKSKPPNKKYAPLFRSVSLKAAMAAADPAGKNYESAILVTSSSDADSLSEVGH